MTPAPGSDTALVVTAHGSPGTLDDLPAFLATIRRGRPAPPEVLAEVRRRYEAIGGRSPLLDVTRAQADALARRVGLPARVAMRLWAPRMDDVARELAAEGVRRVVSVPLAPYSLHVYHDALAAAVASAAPGVELVRVGAYHRHPSFVRALADEAARALSAAPAGSRAALVLTAHSLPVRAIEAGDPYARLFEETTRDVIAALGDRAGLHRVAYQSAGMTGDAWLGPDLHGTLRALASEGATHVVVAPVGFVADHVEVLYDVDVEARQWARELGVTLSRTRTLNDADGLVDALASVVRAAVG